MKRPNVLHSLQAELPDNIDVGGSVAIVDRRCKRRMFVLRVSLLDHGQEPESLSQCSLLLLLPARSLLLAGRSTPMRRA